MTGNVPREALPPPGLGPWPPGWTVDHVAETGSTNVDLLADADRRPDRSVLATGHQVHGRGRLDRRWDAPPGTNLLVSLLFHRVPSVASELTWRVALAAARAASQVAGVDVTLKWPNDLMVGDAKLAGILAQRNASGTVVVGLGCNVRWAPEGAARLGPHVEPMVVLHRLLAAYDDLPADVLPAYRRALATLGRRVVVQRRAGDVTGEAVDVDPDGCLVVVDDPGTAHRFAAGDVVHVRAAE